MESDTKVASRVLHEAGDRLCRNSPKDRIKGSALTCSGRRRETEEVSTATETVKCGTENKERDREVRRFEECRTIDSLRKYAESVGRGDDKVWRSAKELGINFPDYKCSCSPTGAHYYEEIARRIYRCKYCWTPLWQPYEMHEAKLFADSIRHVGLNRAYQVRVGSRKSTIEVITMLMALSSVRNSMPDADEVYKAIVDKYNSDHGSAEGPVGDKVASIVSDKIINHRGRPRLGW